MANKGLNKNKKKLLLYGSLSSLEKSFTASEKGCKIPKMDVLLGPFRSWERPKIFRSIKVKKATLIKTGTIIKIREITWEKILFLF